MKSVFLFGGTGSLGMATVEFWKDKVEKFILFGRDEGKHWKVRNKFPTLKIETCIGDIACFEQVKSSLLTHLPEYIIVMSAMKHIDYCEKFIESCLKTNITGLANVIKVVQENCWSSLKKVCFVSTDKACSPVNVYGMSKSIAERMLRVKSPVPLVAVRYGNVLDSSGSVIPLFRQQAISTEVKEITVTHPEMTRFIIDLKEAVELIQEALENAQHGEIYIPILNSMRIDDVAKIFSTQSGKPIKYTGIRTGEKLHEALYSDQEKSLVFRRGNRYVLGLDPETKKRAENPALLQILASEKNRSDTIPEVYDSFTTLLEPRFVQTRLAPYLPEKKGKIIVFGATGMLGKYVVKYFTRQGYNVVPILKSSFEILITDEEKTITEELEFVLGSELKDCLGVINCLGLTNKRKVDIELFYLVNSVFPFALASVCQKRGMTVVHASTDCVFSGESQVPYTEMRMADSTEIYGKSKAKGDIHPWLSVIRTSIVGEGGGLLDWFLKNEEKILEGYLDAHWNGVTCLQWAKMAENVIKAPYYGILHVDTGYSYSKFELLNLFNTVYGLKKTVFPKNAERCYRVLGSEYGRIFSVPGLIDQLEEQKKFSV